MMARMPHCVLLDVHVPIAVAESLRRRGIDVMTAQDAGFALLNDEALLQQAADQARVLVTQDADFLEIVSRWNREGRECCGVVFARQGIAVGVFLESLELCLYGLSEEELRNQVVFVPLR
jgi:hypothetical protein